MKRYVITLNLLLDSESKTTAEEEAARIVDAIENDLVYEVAHPYAVIQVTD